MTFPTKEWFIDYAVKDNMLSIYLVTPNGTTQVTNTPVLFAHYRLYTWQGKPISRGGATIAAIFHNNTIHYGVSICSYQDMFNKSVGRAHAVQNLVWGNVTERHFCYPVPSSFPPTLNPMEYSITTYKMGKLLNKFPPIHINLNRAKKDYKHGSFYYRRGSCDHLELQKDDGMIKETNQYEAWVKSTILQDLGG